MEKVKVCNMQSHAGNDVPNQFEIRTDKGVYFQSYQSTIAFRPYYENGKREKIILDENKWDYSCTTGKYRNMFLGENKKETQKKIDSGKYELANLN